MKNIIKATFLILVITACITAQQSQNMRVPKKSFIDVGLRWENQNGDRLPSNGTITLSGPDGKQLYTGHIGKIPLIPFEADKMPAGTYTITITAPESADYPAVNWSWSFSHLAVDTRSAENYSILVVFDPSGRHGQVVFQAVERF